MVAFVDITKEPTGLSRMEESKSTKPGMLTDGDRIASYLSQEEGCYNGC